MNALYGLCIKILRQKPSFKEEDFWIILQQLRKWKERLSLLMICNSVLETYTYMVVVPEYIFSSLISGRNYASNVSHSQPSSQLCANSTKRRSGTTPKIQRNFAIWVSKQDSQDNSDFYLIHKTLVVWLAWTWQLSRPLTWCCSSFATLPLKKCLQHPTASQCLKTIEKVSFYNSATFTLAFLQ